MGWSEIMMHPIEGATKTPLNGWVRNNDAFTAGRAVAHLTHASSQKVGGCPGSFFVPGKRHEEATRCNVAFILCPESDGEGFCLCEFLLVS